MMGVALGGGQDALKRIPSIPWQPLCIEMRKVCGAPADRRRDRLKSEEERLGNRRRRAPRDGAATATEWAASGTEVPRVVQSLLPVESTATSAPSGNASAPRRGEAGARPSRHLHVWRAGIILATADGAGTVEIVRRTGKSKPCVWRWQDRFMAEGVDGLLRDKTRPSRIPPLEPDVALRIVEMD